MTHPNEDDLLQYVLQTLGESDHEGISEHLSQCAECRVLERKMQIQVERLGSVRIQVDLPKVPGLPRSSRVPARRWGWAAGLAAGFLLGILTARFTEDRHPVAVPQRLVTTTVLNFSSGYVPCQAMDVKTVFAR